MNETTNKEYRYMNSNASITSDGTLVTTPAIYGTDSGNTGAYTAFRKTDATQRFPGKGGL
ncbi:hypothetical protein NXX71_18365 [Bacteroides faecis]|nr:hypothetical protein [Bacteroides faecis]